jgi:hypothetical protein
VLEQRGLLVRDSHDPSLDFEIGSSLDHIQAASIQYRIAIGPHAGRKALTLYRVPPLEEELTIPLLARMFGFHGVFAPNSKDRHKIVPRRSRGKVDSDKPLAPMNWAQRLKRVFAIDIEKCPDCGGKLRVIACIEEPQAALRMKSATRSPIMTQQA